MEDLNDALEMVLREPEVYCSECGWEGDKNDLGLATAVLGGVHRELSACPHCNHYGDRLHFNSQIINRNAAKRRQAELAKRREAEKAKLDQKQRDLGWGDW